MSQESATYSAWPGGNFSRTYGSVSPQDSTDRPAMSPEIRFRIVTASYVAQTNSVSCVSMMSPQSAAPDPSSGVDQARWFDNEVRPHETSLRSYLKGSFPAMRDIDDVVQETYLRICKTHATQPIQCVRAFLFGIARRLAVDVIRKERRTTAHNVGMDFGAFDVREDKADAAEATSMQQEIELLAEAIHALPARCREVMILRKIERLSHREIAEKLGITVATVEAQISRGMEKCTCYLRSRGVAITPRRSST